MGDTHRSVFNLRLSSPSLGDVKLYDVDQVDITRKTSLKVVATMNRDSIGQGFQSGIDLFEGSLKTYIRKPKPEADWELLRRLKEQFDMLFNEGTPASPGRRGRWKGIRVGETKDSVNKDGDAMMDVAILILDEIYET